MFELEKPILVHLIKVQKT